MKSPSFIDAAFRAEKPEKMAKSASSSESWANALPITRFHYQFLERVPCRRNNMPFVPIKTGCRQASSILALFHPSTPFTGILWTSPKSDASSRLLKQRSGTPYVTNRCPVAYRAAHLGDSSHSKKDCTETIHPLPPVLGCKDQQDPSSRSDPLNRCRRSCLPTL